METELSLNREDGNLEYIVINESMAGLYKCSVATSAGITNESSNYQLLIVGKIKVVSIL